MRRAGLIEDVAKACVGEAMRREFYARGGAWPGPGLDVVRDRLNGAHLAAVEALSADGARVLDGVEAARAFLLG